MTVRAYVTLGLIIVVCLAAIVISPFSKEQLTAYLLATWGWPPLFDGLLFGPVLDRAPLGNFGGLLSTHASWGTVSSEIASLAFRYLIGLVFLFYKPQHMIAMRNQFRAGTRHWLRLAAIGLLLGLMCLVLMLLGWGGSVPLLKVAQTIIVFLGAMTAIRIGGTALALYIGQTIGKRIGLAESSIFIELALGTLILFALAALPGVGIVLALVINAHATGALAVTFVEMSRLHLGDTET